MHSPLSADDAELAERIRVGDSAAFRTVVHAHFEAAARVAFRLLHSQDAAKDVAQAIFSQLWHRRAEFCPTRSIQNYILMAARNNALMELRQRHVRERHQETTISGGELEDRARVQSDAATIDNRATVATLLGMLSDRRRQALELRYLEQLSYSEVGQILGISAGAAEQLVIRALDTLRQAWPNE